LYQHGAAAVTPPADERDAHKKDDALEAHLAGVPEHALAVV